VWVARMAGELGAEPVLCGFVGGETGSVLRPLLERLPGEYRLGPTGARRRPPRQEMTVKVDQAWSTTAPAWLSASSSSSAPSMPSTSSSTSGTVSRSALMPNTTLPS